MITSNLEREVYGINKSMYNYQIYLDESGGNIGKLKHNPDSSNYFNSIIPQKGIPQVFVLAGVAQLTDKELIAPNWKDFLKLQNNELKFSKIGKNFLNKLGSKELNAVLQWIKSNNHYIHFALYDWVYFYNVDIIDSVLASDDISASEILYHIFNKLKINNKYDELEEYKCRVGLDTDDEFIICMFYLKELLHDFMIGNLQWFLSEIYQNHYKKVDNYEQPVFLDNLYKKIASNDKYKILEYFLEKIDRTADLSFIYDGMDSQINSDKTFIMLVDSMSPPYQNYITTFPQSKLYFDSGMENVFLESQKQDRQVFFEKSNENYIIQASDIIAGLLAGIGEQIQKYDEHDFEREFASKLNPNHKENLKLLAEIYSVSENESNGLFTHFFAPLSYVNRLRNFILSYG